MCLVMHPWSFCAYARVRISDTKTCLRKPLSLLLKREKNVA